MDEAVGKGVGEDGAGETAGSPVPDKLLIVSDSTAREPQQRQDEPQGWAIVWLPVTGAKRA